MMLKRLLFLVFVLLSLHANSQNINPYILDVTDRVSFDTVLKNMEEFESLGIKSVNTRSLENTKDWLVQKYLSYGYSDVELDTFNFSGDTLFNVIITKKGVTAPDRYLIVCGHYDTKNGPGVNDNGSGISAILEAARVLKDLPTAFSIKFINFSMEEPGLIGSSHYVNNKVVPQNLDLLLVFNIDEVGGVAGMQNTHVVCERDEAAPLSNNAASALYTDTLAVLTGLYTSLKPRISFAFNSDYVPFEKRGFVITGYYEDNVSPLIHTIKDSLKSLDTGYVHQVARGVTAASLFFAKPLDPLASVGRPLAGTVPIPVFPNPFRKEVSIDLSGLNEEQVEFYMTDLAGRVVFSEFLAGGDILKREFEDLSPGLYFYKIRNTSGQSLQEGKLVKTAE